MMTLLRDCVVVAFLLAAQTVQADNAAAPEPRNTNWLSYNANVNGERYAALGQINAGNATRLGEVCRLAVDDAGAFHAGLLQIDGVLYFTTASDTLAVDAANCALRWRHHYAEQEPGITALRVNRGLAYANGRLFRGTLDGRLLALEAETGRVLWSYQIGDPQQGEFFAAAPQIYKGLVIIGAAGGDWGIRGRVMAFDVATGREAWTFHTIPRDDEPGAESWKDPNSARYGGGGTWTTYTLDMAAGELFVPVGNPAPDFLPEKRPGENLYTNSLVVLEAGTGRLKWYHQLISNDGLDLDLGAAPLLYFTRAGERMVALGSKDVHLYGISRETRELVYRTPVTTVREPRQVPGTRSVEMCPGILGGVEWNGPALDKLHGQVVVGAVDWCSTITPDREFTFVPGQLNFGGTFKFQDPARGWIVAVDRDTGAEKWKFETAAPQISGITPTAGGLVFAGDTAGNFTVLDSGNGKLLFKAETGGALAGGVITYMRDGRQYVAFTSGNVSRITFGAVGKPTLVIYAFGGKASAATPAVILDDAARAGGAEIYGKVCAACHGGQGEGGVGPALKGLAGRMSLADTVRWIEDPVAVKPGTNMPRLYPGQIDRQGLEAVARYVQAMQ